MIRRRLTALVAALALTLTVFAGPAAASPVNGQYCASNLQTNRHLGNTVDGGSSYTVYSVSAQIRTYAVGNHFHPCTYPTGSAGNDGPSAWVALEPGTTNVKYGSGTAILQVGVISCNDNIASPACDWTNNTKHYFWAWGGCGTYLPTPQPISGTVPDGSYIAFAIVRRSSPVRWTLDVDGVTKVTVLPTDAAVSCWINAANGNKRGEWAGETSDDNDHIGDISNETGFHYIRYSKVIGVPTTWLDVDATNSFNISPSWPNGSTHFGDGYAQFDPIYKGEQFMWTVPSG